MEHTPARRILSQAEAAQRLGVDRRTINRMLKSGDLPYVAIGPRKILYEDLLEEWLESQTHRPERAAS